MLCVWFSSTTKKFSTLFSLVMLLLTGLGLATKIDPATKEREEARIWITVRILFWSKYVLWEFFM